MSSLAPYHELGDVSGAGALIENVLILDPQSHLSRVQTINRPAFEGDNVINIRYSAGGGER